MRAWQVTELGEPRDVLTETDTDIPHIHGAQLLVRTLAAPANFPDVLMCRGMYQVRPPLPFTPGVEGCFEVVDVGPHVTGWAAGDRVIGGTVLPHGSFAEYAVLDSASTFAAPVSLTHEEAAALFIGYQTGWFALHRRARIQPGETLLIHAGHRSFFCFVAPFFPSAPDDFFSLSFVALLCVTSLYFLLHFCLTAARSAPGPAYLRLASPSARSLHPFPTPHPALLCALDGSAP